MRLPCPPVKLSVERARAFAVSRGWETELRRNRSHAEWLSMRISSLLVVAAAVATVSAALVDTTLRRELAARRGAAAAKPPIRQAGPCPAATMVVSQFCQRGR